MQINDLTRHYSNHTTSSAETMIGTKGVERLASMVREMAVGNIFEGTVNSVKNGQVVLGLSNGSELLARLDAGMNIEAGRSMFFQVKANDGETIAIRPYTVDGNGANLTLVNALKAANLSITDRFLNMANTMMQEQMPIDKSSLSQMARILAANPDMNVQTLVQMKKLDIPITEQMVAQFENYMDDRSAMHSAIDRFVEQLPQALMNDSLPPEQLKAFDSQFLTVLAEGLNENTQSAGEVSNAPGESFQTVGEAIQTSIENAQMEGDVVQITGENKPMETDTQLTGANTHLAGEVSNAPGESFQTVGEAIQTSIENAQMEGDVVQITGEQSQATSEASNTNISQSEDAFGKLSDSQKEQLLNALKQNLGEFGASKDDNAFSLLNKISHQLVNVKNITESNVKELFSDKHVQNFLKEVLEQQLLVKPKDVGNSEKIQKLYEQMEGKMARLDTLMQNAGIKDVPINQTLTDIRGNVDFMNQMNQVYTYVQIPLKMSNQNASAHLYVYTNKKDLQDPERDLTAFLHLDLEHLGSTDVSVRMHRKEVSTKFYMNSDESYDLVKIYLPELEERLRKKGYNCTIEIENEGKKVNFVEDFLKKDAPSSGQLHRYSFDVRA